MRREREEGREGQRRRERERGRKREREGEGDNQGIIKDFFMKPKRTKKERRGEIARVCL
jgi:hypothetical protein